MTLPIGQDTIVSKAVSYHIFTLARNLSAACS